MRFDIDKKRLEKYIGMAKKFCASSGPRPILANILFEAKGDFLILRSTNLNVFYTVKVPQVTTEREGTVCVPVKALTDVVLKMPTKSGTLSIDADGVKFKVSADGGKSVADIDVYATIDDFPIISFSGEGSSSFDSKQFCEIVKLASSASDTCGVQSTAFDCAESAVVSTDSKRIAIHKIPSSIDLSMFKGFVLPSDILMDCVPILLESDKVTLSIGGGIATFESGESAISIRMIDAKVIQWKRVVPATINNTIKIETKDLEACVKYVAEVSKSDTNMIAWKISSDGCEVSAQDDKIGFAKNSVDAEIDFFEKLQFGLNAKFVSEFLKLGKGKTIIGYMQHGFPISFSFDSNPDFTYIVMPMSLG